MGHVGVHHQIKDEGLEGDGHVAEHLLQGWPAGKRIDRVAVIINVW